jgi:hypothetical protein
VTRISPVPDLNVDDAPYEGYFDAVTAGANYLGRPGADLASAATINPTNRWHAVTGTATITNITDTAGPVAGQPLSLFFTGAATLTHGTGNIRLLGNVTRTVAANTVVEFVYDGTNWLEHATFPRAEAGYVEFTASVVVNPTTEATAVSLVALPPFYADGATTFELEFFSPCVRGNTDDSELHLILFDDTTVLGELIDWKRGSTSGQMKGPVLGRRRVTPGAGVHTYEAKGYNTGAFVTVEAGGGGSGNFMPGYLRLIRVL